MWNCRNVWERGLWGLFRFKEIQVNKHWHVLIFFYKNFKNIYEIDKSEWITSIKPLKKKKTSNKHIKQYSKVSYEKLKMRSAYVI